MAKPKLALIPASQGSKLFSVLPSSGVGDFDFTRSGSATRINSQGLIEEVANGQSRLNYPMIDGVVKGCPHHILEPERLQKIQYSEDFSQSYWTKNGSSVTSGFVSPKGDLSAFKLVEDTSNGNHRVDTQGISITNGVSHSFSMFFKYDNSVEWIRVREFGINAFAYFNIKDNTTGATNLVNNSEKIEDFGNGWKRVSFTYNSTTSGANFRIYLANGNNSDSYQGDGTSGVYIYGAQLEQGSYLTSYIPNFGTSAGITRQAETATGSGDAATFNDSEGVLFAEVSALDNDSTNRRITIDDGTGNNRIILGYYSLSNSILIDIASQATGAYTKVAYVPAVTNFNKIVLKYKENDFALWINGLKIDVDLSGITPINLNNLKFDGGSGAVPFYGNTKQIQYFQTALTDSELEELTSLESFIRMAEGQLYTIE